MTGLDMCNSKDRRTISVIAAIVIMMAVFVILSIKFGADGLFFIPIVMSGVIRVASRVWIAEDKKNALEADFFFFSRPSRFFILMAGPIEGAPERGPPYIGDIMGFID